MFPFWIWIPVNIWLLTHWYVRYSLHGLSIGVPNPEKHEESERGKSTCDPGPPPLNTFPFFRMPISVSDLTVPPFSGSHSHLCSTQSFRVLPLHNKYHPKDNSVFLFPYSFFPWVQYCALHKVDSKPIMPAEKAEESKHKNADNVSLGFPLWFSG